MATIKSYTDLQQSKKLAEILPLESADMGWNVFVDGTTRILPINDWDLVKDGSGNVKFYHAWSLAALLDILPDNYIDVDDIIKRPSLMKTKDSRYMVIYSAFQYTSLYNNSVDACYEMIIRLNELNLL